MPPSAKDLAAAREFADMQAELRRRQLDATAEESRRLAATIDAQRAQLDRVCALLEAQGAAIAKLEASTHASIPARYLGAVERSGGWTGVALVAVPGTLLLIAILLLSHVDLVSLAQATRNPGSTP